MSAQQENAANSEKVEGEICTTSEGTPEAQVTRPSASGISMHTNASKAVVNKMSEAILCRTQLHNYTAKTNLIECQLTSLCWPSSVEVNIKTIGPFHHLLQYTPIVRGQHLLTVTVDGEQIEGSPYPVFVSIHPTLQGFPVNNWNSAKPEGITVNSVGEIIVAEYLGQVVVLDKQGKRLRSVRHPDIRRGLVGVSVDSEDNIYFVDIHTSRIFRSDKNCSDVEVKDVEQVNGPGHYGIAVVGDKVMVTECGNKGYIMVYDRELKYARKIVSNVATNKVKYFCLSPDSYRNVYVTVGGSSDIHVYREDGEFLRCLCWSEDLVLLNCASHLCVAGQYVYVSYYKSYRIIVLTTEGDYVTSFGGGECDDVCVGQDGTVYACNCELDMITLF